MGKTHNIRSNYTARTILVILVGIHLILPYTPINKQETIITIIGANIIGVVFGYLYYYSFTYRYKAFLRAFGFFILVNAVAAITGTSPLSEGLIIKLILLTGLFYGVLHSWSRRKARII